MSDVFLNGCAAVSEQNNDLDIGLALKLAVLRPGPKNQLVPTLIPDWWTDEIGVERNGTMEITSLFLRDFLTTTGIWETDPQHDFIQTTPLFEITAGDEGSLQLQALAVSQNGSRALLVRNLNTIDSWLSSVLQTARTNMLRQASARSEHRRQVATISADRDEAQRMEQIKGQFLANMSHELRTPLTTILGMTSMAQRKPEELSPAHRGYLDAISVAANQLLRLGNDILDLSRIQADRLDLNKAPFSMQTSMAEFQNVWELHATNAGLQFELVKGPEVPNVVLGDEFRLRQILTNLVANAVKFTEQGSVKLTINVPQPDWLQFMVEDTGIGMKPEQLARIFDTFTQVDDSSRRLHQGAGLGLAIAANLASLMGGKIEVTSEVGLGSRFWFVAHLPRITAVEETKTPTKPDPPRPEGTISILVAEDHDLNRSIIVETLESEGFETFEARNGEEALAAWRSRGFDVVLMDCQMPVMSGLDAIEVIRSEESESRTPIVALTAHAMRNDRQRLLNHGADRYLAKPFESDELVDLVSELAGKR